MSQEHRYIIELLIPQSINTSISYASSSTTTILQPTTLLPNTSFERPQATYKYTYVPATAAMSQTPSTTNERAAKPEVSPPQETAVQDQVGEPLSKLASECLQKLILARLLHAPAKDGNDAIRAKISDPDLFLKAENSFRVWLPRLTDEHLAKLTERKMLQQDDRLEGWDEGPEEKVKEYLESKAKHLEEKGSKSCFDRARQEAKTELGEAEYMVKWMMCEIEWYCDLGTSAWQESGSGEMEGGLDEQGFHVLVEGQFEEDQQGREGPCWGLYRIFTW